MMVEVMVEVVVMEGKGPCLGMLLTGLSGLNTAQQV